MELAPSAARDKVSRHYFQEADLMPNQGNRGRDSEENPNRGQGKSSSAGRRGPESGWIG